MSRISSENQSLEKNVLGRIWATNRKIGTIPDPVDHLSEEDLFREVIGTPMEHFRHPGRKGQLNVLNAGINTIQYDWETVVAYEVDGETTTYKPSLSLFKAITGDAAAPALYFMIDAMNVSLHKALIHDKGAAKEKDLIYLETRERLNDPASLS